MRIAHVDAPGSISVADAPDPTVGTPTDAVVTVLASCLCGSDLSDRPALSIARPGGAIGFVGVPAGVDEGPPWGKLFGRNVNVAGGVAPVRTYRPELLADVLSGELDPSPVWTCEVPLEDIAEGYRQRDQRESVTVLVRP